MNRILGVVLAGGKSTRMGRDKASLMHPTGVTYLQHACDRLSAIADATVVVGGNHQVTEVTILPDRIRDRGPAMGLLTAMQHAAGEGYQACVVTGVDFPNLVTADLRELIATWKSNPGHPVVATGKDRFQPLIAVYPMVLQPNVEALTETDHRSLYRWLQTIPLVKVKLPPHALTNHNEPA